MLAGFGGASIIDSFLAIRESESQNPQTINCFPDSEVTNVAGSPFRAVTTSGGAIGALPFTWSADQTELVAKHKDDMLVATATGTSVNHAVAQKRSITGDGIWSGRTLQEAVANEYGDGLLIPNVNMGSLGFLEKGDDLSLPDYAFAEPVADPALWPLGLDGVAGVEGAPDRVLVDIARQVRDERADPESMFFKTFSGSPRIQRWLQQRSLRPQLEQADLIRKLEVLSDSSEYPFGDFDLSVADEAADLASVFPLMNEDTLEAQAALAFLLIRNRVSAAVTLSSSFSLVLTGNGTALQNPPLAFDYSHNAHRATQAVMWKRTLSIADRLIDLLKSVELDPATGESFWDRTLIYVATDFGRDKGRKNGETNFGTGHHLNNGNLIISPLVKGNTVLGGVDPDTGLTHGWDPLSGNPIIAKENPQSDIYAGILQALGVSTTGSGLPNVSAMVKGA